MIDENAAFLRDITEGRLPVPTLIDLYIRQGSVMELNISCTMRTKAIETRDLTAVQVAIRALVHQNIIHNQLTNESI